MCVLRNAPESSNISDNLAAHVGAKTSVTGFKSMTGVAVGVTGVAVMLVLRHLLGAGAKHLEETRKALAAVKTQDAETCTRISSAASAWARRVSPAKCVQNFSSNTRRTTRLQLKYAVYELPAAPAARQRVQGVFELPQIRVKYFLRYFPPCSCPRAHTVVVGVVAAFSRFSPTPTPSPGNVRHAQKKTTRGWGPQREFLKTSRQLTTAPARKSARKWRCKLLLQGAQALTPCLPFLPALPPLHAHICNCDAHNYPTQRMARERRQHTQRAQHTSARCEREERPAKLLSLASSWSIAAWASSSPSSSGSVANRESTCTRPHNATHNFVCARCSRAAVVDNYSPHAGGTQRHQEHKPVR